MSSAPAAAPLLEPETLRRLEQWTLAVRRSASGQYGGERRSNRHGHSVEFADFRNYVPGDDVRFVDWNLYARLERLFLKLFLKEQELNVHLLVDLSESMTFGTPAKALTARKTAAALAFIALANQDGVSIQTGGGEPGPGGFPFLPPCRGRGYVNRMLRFLETAPEGGALGLAAFAEKAMMRVRRPGLTVLVSDLLDPDGCEAPLRSIVARRHEAIVVHVLSEEDLNPSLEGDLRLVDCERGDGIEASLTPRLLREYRRRAEAWAAGVESHCLSRGAAYVRVAGGGPPEEAVLKTLRRLGRIK